MTRQITATGVALIKRFEGFSPTVYKDAVGIPTIGYGHVVRKGETFTRLTEAEAEALLRQDVGIAERAALRLTTRALTDGQFDALVSFVFNLGSGAYQRSTLRRKVNGGYDAEVPEEFLRWVWAGGRKLRGLIRRRTAEAELYHYG